MIVIVTDCRVLARLVVILMSGVQAVLMCRHSGLVGSDGRGDGWQVAERRHRFGVVRVDSHGVASFAKRRDNGSDGDRGRSRI